MSNIGSTALSTSKSKTKSHPDVPSPTKKQQAFNRGTMNLLDEARAVVENAVGQGQQLNPLIYQMLGLQPQFTDNTAQLEAAKGQLDKAQQQYSDAQQTLTTLQALPKGRRSAQQKKQLKQLKKQMPALNTQLGAARDAHGQLETQQKQITGLSRMDPNAIPKESPFSGQNALNQAQATEAARLNQYLQGGEVDPTLKHQYTTAEQALRAKLAQRFGPDYESSTVGQMALQNFSRQKNEAFATYNQQQVEKYNQLAFQGQANLQNLLQSQIGLMREPSQTQQGAGAALSNQAGARLTQQQAVQNWLLGRGGMTGSSVNYAPLSTAGGGLGALLNTQYTDSSGKTASLGNRGASAVGQAGSGLYDWATGTNAGIAADAAGVDAALVGGAASDAAIAEGAAGVDAGAAAML